MAAVEVVTVSRVLVAATGVEVMTLVAPGIVVVVVVDTVDTVTGITLVETTAGEGSDKNRPWREDCVPTSGALKARRLYHVWLSSAQGDSWG